MDKLDDKYQRLSMLHFSSGTKRLTFNGSYGIFEHPAGDFLISETPQGMLFESKTFDIGNYYTVGRIGYTSI